MRPAVTTFTNTDSCILILPEPAPPGVLVSVQMDGMELTLAEPGDYCHSGIDLAWANDELDVMEVCNCDQFVATGSLEVIYSATCE